MPGTNVVITGDPGVGKTAISLNIAMEHGLGIISTQFPSLLRPSGAHC